MMFECPIWETISIFGLSSAYALMAEIKEKAATQTKQANRPGINGSAQWAGRNECKNRASEKWPL
jgi:hypothetical protein